MNAPFNPGRGGAPRDPFAAFVCDEPTAELLRSVAVEIGWSGDKINKGGLRNAVQTLSVSASPNVLFVDLSESSDPLNDINALAEVCEPGTVVIASGQVNDVRLYRDLVNSGIQDYLLKPFHVDQLRDALTNAQVALAGPRIADGPASDKPHVATAFIGVRGGVGASSIATSVAWLFGDKVGRSTAMLDLDLHFGSCALALDLEPGRGLIDAIDNPSRIDGLFIERAMVRVNDKLAVLSAEAPIHTPVVCDGSAFFQLHEEMRHAFECSVIDLPRQMMIQHPHMLHDVATTVVVTEMSLAAARDTIRVLSWLKTQAPQTKVLVLANKVPVVGQPEISRKDFENSIERKIDFMIGYDAKLATQAAKLGKPLAEAGKGSKAMQPLLALVDALMDAAEAVEGSGKGKSLLGKLGDLKGLLPSKPKSKVKTTA